MLNTGDKNTFVIRNAQRVSLMDIKTGEIMDIAQLFTTLIDVEYVSESEYRKGEQHADVRHRIREAPISERPA